MPKRLISFSFLTILIAAPLFADSSDPVLKKGVSPTYPTCAIEKRVQGTLRIRATLHSDGGVIQAILIGKQDEPIMFPKLKDDGQFGYQCLCKAAQKAALFWEFQKQTTIKELVLGFPFDLASETQGDEDLYPVYTYPFEVRVRGLLPTEIIKSTSSTPLTLPNAKQRHQ